MLCTFLMTRITCVPHRIWLEMTICGKHQRECNVCACAVRALEAATLESGIAGNERVYFRFSECERCIFWSTVALFMCASTLCFGANNIIVYMLAMERIWRYFYISVASRVCVCVCVCRIYIHFCRAAHFRNKIVNGMRRWVKRCFKLNQFVYAQRSRFLQSVSPSPSPMEYALIHLNFLFKHEVNWV